MTIAFLKQMLVGEFKESNAWFIDAEKSLEGMIQANIQSLTKPKEEQGLEEFKKRNKELLKHI